MCYSLSLLVLSLFILLNLISVVESVKDILVRKKRDEYEDETTTWEEFYTWLGRKFRRGFQFFTNLLNFLCMCTYFGYIVLVLIWFIFGACVKPELYLSYAAAAGALVTFAAAKANDLQSLQTQLKEYINEMTKEVINELLAESKAIMQQIQSEQLLGGDLSSFSSEVLVRSLYCTVHGMHACMMSGE